MDVDDDLRRPGEVDVEQRQPLGRPRAGARPASTTNVSQKMLAVSASAIGSRRCSGVRPASVRVVVGVAELVRRRLRRVERARPVEQHERAVVDERHAERAAGLAVPRPGVDPLLVERPVDEPGEPGAVASRTRSRTMSTPSSHETSAAANGSGATRSHHGSAPSWPCSRALSRIHRRKSGRASTTARCIASNVARLTLLANSDASSGDAQRRRRLTVLASPLMRVHRRRDGRRRPSATPPSRRRTRPGGVLASVGWRGRAPPASTVRGLSVGQSHDRP